MQRTLWFNYSTIHSNASVVFSIIGNQAAGVHVRAHSPAPQQLSVLGEIKQFSPKCKLIASFLHQNSNTSLQHRESHSHRMMSVEKCRPLTPPKHNLELTPNGIQNLVCAGNASKHHDSGCSIYHTSAYCIGQKHPRKHPDNAGVSFCWKGALLFLRCASVIM